MQQWPSFMPEFRVGMNESNVNEIARTEDIGRSIQRQTQRSGLIQVSANLVLTAPLFAVFEQWVNVHLHSGADWFTGRYFVKNVGLSTATMRLVNGDYAAKPASPNIWEVDVQLEVNFG